jgi:hypothetical protein
MQPSEVDPIPTNEVANPFALMTSPEAVFAALERSDRLARLKSTICRPLDKPRPEKPLVELRAFDEEIESAEPLLEPFEEPPAEQ